MTPWAVELAAVETGDWAFYRAGSTRCAEVVGGDAVVDGRPARSLAAAVEVYSRKSGRSTWGHLSVRFQACQDGAFFDAEYEFYRFNHSTSYVLDKWLPDAGVLNDPVWTRAQRGAMVIYRNGNPGDDGDFALASRLNREIYELWITQTDAQRDAWLTAVDRLWTDQVAAMDAGQPLPDRYAPTTRNCTTPVRLAFGEETALPFGWKRWLLKSGRVERTVVYPSAWALRQMVRREGGMEAVVALAEQGWTVERFRPLFRWSRALPAGVRQEIALPPAEPASP